MKHREKKEKKNNEHSISDNFKQSHMCIKFPQEKRAQKLKNNIMAKNVKKLQRKDGGVRTAEEKSQVQFYLHSVGMGKDP